MLNYIWAGLIVLSLVFALVRDIGDIRRDTYRNGAALPVVITQDSAADPTKVHLVINPQTYRDFYHADDKPADSYAAIMTKTPKGAELRFPADAVFPKTLAKIRDSTTPEDDRRLAAEVVPTNGGNALRFPPVRFQTMLDIANASMTAAKAA